MFCRASGARRFGLPWYVRWSRSSSLTSPRSSSAFLAVQLMKATLVSLLSRFAGLGTGGGALSELGTFNCTVLCMSTWLPAGVPGFGASARCLTSCRNSAALVYEVLVFRYLFTCTSDGCRLCEGQWSGGRVSCGSVYPTGGRASRSVLAAVPPNFLSIISTSPADSPPRRA